MVEEEPFYVANKVCFQGKVIKESFIRIRLERCRYVLGSDDRRTGNGYAVAGYGTASCHAFG
jgi:hypothetical protein